MRLMVVPSNPIEAMRLALGLVPTPLLETQVSFTTARVIMAGSDLGIYQALEHEPLSARNVAERCATDARATKLLLDALVGCGYLDYESSSKRYALTRTARRWLLPSQPQSLHEKMLFQKLEWDILTHLEEYVRTGTPRDLHQKSDAAKWESYQRGMRSIGRMVADEVGKRTPVPKNAREMLDLGGSVGVLSSAICRRHPALRSTILDLPEAVEHAARLLTEENMGERVRHRRGNALTDDLGEGMYDLVFMSNLAHHFSDGQNRELTRRIARALKPGGVFVVQEILRHEEPTAGDQTGTSIGLYFGLTSQSGCWSLAEISNWQKEAGLEIMEPVHLRSGPGIAQQPAIKLP